MPSTKGLAGAGGASPAVLGPLAPVLDTLRPELRAPVREAVVSLAAGVAHEINNPLGYALSNVTFVVDRIRKGERSPGTDAELLSSLEEALYGLERVGRVVANLVVSSRADGASARLLDVRTVVDLALSMASQGSGFPKHLVREYREVAPVKVDEAALVGLLCAMLAGVDRPGGGAPPRVEVRVAPEGRGKLAIEVGPFVGDAELATSTELATTLGGHLSIDENGHPRVVRLVLPTAVNAPRRRATPVAQPAAGRARVQALVIDDEGLMTKVVERILSRDGLEVLCFSDARDALLHLGSSPAPDLILCDLMMPEVSGMEFHERLQAVNPVLAQRVVFVTGGATTARAREFLQQVPNSRLAKPFSAAALRAAVREQLERR